jgi:uncharacterized membrane protein YccF (DUF307 family)
MDNRMMSIENSASCVKADKEVSKVVNVIVGAIAVLLGLWLMMQNWWATIDLLRTVFPFLLTVYGVVALIAGLKRLGRASSDVQE